MFVVRGFAIDVPDVVVDFVKYGLDCVSFQGEGAEYGDIESITASRAVRGHDRIHVAVRYGQVVIVSQPP